MTEASARDEVLTAAATLFYERGIQAVGMDAVRAESGVSLKRIYAMFPSKDDLVTAVLARGTATWEAGIEAAAAGAQTPREELLAVFDFLRTWFEEDTFRGCVFINSFGELGAVSPRVADLAREQKRSFADYVSERVRQVGGPELLARQLVILAEGAQASAAIAGSVETADDAKAAAEALIDLALNPSPSPKGD